MGGGGGGGGQSKADHVAAPSHLAESQGDVQLSCNSGCPSGDTGDTEGYGAAVDRGRPSVTRCGMPAREHSELTPGQRRRYNQQRGEGSIARGRMQGRRTKTEGGGGGGGQYQRVLGNRQGRAPAPGEGKVSSVSSEGKPEALRQGCKPGSGPIRVRGQGRAATVRGGQALPQD